MTRVNYSKALGLSAILACLCSCESVVHPPVAIQQEITTATEQLERQANQPPPLPHDVMQELITPEQVRPMSHVSPVRFSIAADRVEAGSFFASLVEGTPYSVAIHPELTGEISLNLQQVTLEEAIDVVEAIYGFDIQRSGNILQVFPSKIRTETFAIDYLMLSRMGSSRTTINSSSLVDGDQQNSNNQMSQQSLSSSSGNNGSNDSGMTNNTGTLIRTESELDFWKELETSIRLMVGPGEGKAVITSPQSGLLTVRAMPNELSQIKSFVSRLQNRVQRQVLLEAKILEVRLSDGYQQGINWNALANGTAGFSGGVTSLPVAGNSISNVIGGVFSVAYKSNDFTAVIDLLKTQGNVNVLSSPRISASNNQKAVIKVGTDEYFVTNVSTTTVTGTATSTTPEVELTPFFEGIALDVTPQIDDLGGVLLHVHPSVTDIKEQTKVIAIFEQSLALPMARSDIRETDTIVRAQSGDVVVIGGLMSTVRQQVNSKVPILGDLPLIGGLFTNISESEEKSELVIMLRPTIVEVNNGSEALQQSNRNINQWYKDAQRRFD